RQKELRLPVPRLPLQPRRHRRGRPLAPRPGSPHVARRQRCGRGRLPPLPARHLGARGGIHVSKLGDWFDERTGYRELVRRALEEPVQGGARWTYVWGSALTISLLTQAITGWLLMGSYAPSATTAWASVAHISYSLSAGWIIRGLHHFGAQAMVV